MPDVVVPDVGEGGMEIVLSRWLVAEGQWVEPGDELFELDTAKATVSVQAYAAGRVESISAEEGDEVERGQVVAVLRAPDDPAPAPAPEAGTKPGSQSPAAPPAAPVAVEESVATPEASRRGGAGRPLSPKQKYLAARAASAGTHREAPMTASPGDAAQASAAYRRAAATSVIASWVQTPHLSAVARIARRVGFPALLAALARALRERPDVVVRWDGAQAVPRESAAIGVLWSTERGLVQTCIDAEEAERDAASAIAASAERARLGRLRPGDHVMRAVNVQWIESEWVEHVTSVVPSGDSLMLCVVASGARTTLSLAADQRCIDADQAVGLLDALCSDEGVRG